MLATCGWGGNVALWTADAACKRVWAFRAASERLTGIAWHPHARPQLHSQQPKAAAADGMEGQEGPGAAVSETVALATGCADSTAALWSESGKLLRKLEGHTDRLGRVAFHPMGHHLVRGCRKLISRLSCCSRLWCSASSKLPFWPRVSFMHVTRHPLLLLVLVTQSCPISVSDVCSCSCYVH